MHLGRITCECVRRHRLRRSFHRGSEAAERRGSQVGTTCKGILTIVGLFRRFAKRLQQQPCAGAMLLHVVVTVFLPHFDRGFLKGIVPFLTCGGRFARLGFAENIAAGGSHDAALEPGLTALFEAAEAPAERVASIIGYLSVLDEMCVKIGFQGRRRMCRMKRTSLGCSAPGCRPAPGFRHPAGSAGLESVQRNCRKS